MILYLSSLYTAISIATFFILHKNHSMRRWNYIREDKIIDFYCEYLLIFLFSIVNPIFWINYAIFSWMRRREII